MIYLMQTKADWRPFEVPAVGLFLGRCKRIGLPSHFQDRTQKSKSRVIFPEKSAQIPGLVCHRVGVLSEGLY